MAVFRDIAKKLFGYTSEELPPEVFFIYASIGKPDLRWGDVMIRPKQQVRQRASKVLYDTYHITAPREYPSRLYAQPVPLDEPGIDCFSLRNTWGEDPDLDPLDFHLERPGLLVVQVDGRALRLRIDDHQALGLDLGQDGRRRRRRK